MSVRHRLLVVLFGLIALISIAVVLIPPTTLPFDVKPDYADSSLIVLPRPDMPLPTGVRAGDRLLLADMDSQTRPVFVLGQGNPPADTVLRLTFHRGGKSITLPVSFMRIPLRGAALLTGIGAIALVVLIAALGLLLVWRGHSKASRGVAAWCFAILIGQSLTSLPLPLHIGASISWLGGIVINIGTLLGLFWLAGGLTGTVNGDSGRARRQSTIFSTVLVAYLISVLGFNISYYASASFGPGLYIIIALHLLAFAIPLWILLSGYRQASPINQARIRWVLFSLTMLVFSYIISGSVNLTSLNSALANLLNVVFAAVAFIGFAYAVLRHRLISLELVLNRALVYGLVTSLVVGIFAALLSLLERSALNSETNRFLALLIPLLLGMGLNTLKRTLDTYINKWFFRHRRRAEAALLQFARACGFIDDPDRLLEMAASELHAHSGAQRLAIYLTAPDSAGLRLVQVRGQTGSLSAIEANDLALLRLRAGDTEVDLRELHSGMGADGYLYALSVRGQLLGAVLCGPRPAEAYTPEERRLFALVAQQVSVSLHALRMQAQQQLLQDVASGKADSLPEVRARARSLLETQPIH